MIKLRTGALAGIVFLAMSFACRGDTFVHRQTKEVLHGYIAGDTDANGTLVQTEQKGPQTLNLAQWEITSDRSGRNNKVIILSIGEPIMLQMETQALTGAISASAKEGPLFILLEIDTPGGAVHLAQQICTAITEVPHCPVIAFIKGGSHGGAISAGAAVVLACDKAYMAPNTTIGAATLIAISQAGPEGMKEKFGETVGEKYSSAWQAYLASLAERNNRPGLLARAMVDKDIEVIEVSQGGRKFFIEPENKKPGQTVVQTWSKKDNLLTLTAAEAVKCQIADEVIESRNDLLRLLHAESAQIVINTDAEKAAREFKKVQLRFDELCRKLDLNLKQLEHTKTRSRGMGLLKTIQQDFKSLILLSKRYEDLHLNTQELQARLNSVEAFYQNAKTGR